MSAACQSRFINSSFNRRNTHYLHSSDHSKERHGLKVTAYSLPRLLQRVHLSLIRKFLLGNHRLVHPCSEQPLFVGLCRVKNPPLAQYFLSPKFPYLLVDTGHQEGSGKYTCDCLVSTHAEKLSVLRKSLVSYQNTTLQISLKPI